MEIFFILLVVGNPWQSIVSPLLTHHLKS
jgi:hypothetical protein